MAFHWRDSLRFPNHSQFTCAQLYIQCVINMCISSLWKGIIYGTLSSYHLQVQQVQVMVLKDTWTCPLHKLSFGRVALRQSIDNTQPILTLKLTSQTRLRTNIADRLCKIYFLTCIILSLFSFTYFPSGIKKHILSYLKSALSWFE